MVSAHLGSRSQTEEKKRGHLAHSFERRRQELSPGGAFVSAVGFGTNRLKPSQPKQLAEVRQALTRALELGINLIDLGLAATDGVAERLFCEVFRDLQERQVVSRADLVLVGRAGLLSRSGFEQIVASERAGKGLRDLQMLSPEQAFACDRASIREQVERQVQRLGVEAIDVVLLEQPELILRAKLGMGCGHGDARARLIQVMQTAFAALNELRREGLIGAFGVSSDTLGLPEEVADALQFEDVLDAADAADAQAGLRVLSFPLNWIEVGALLTPGIDGEEGQRKGRSLVEKCDALGIGVLVQRPFNAFSQGRLLRLARPKLTDAQLVGLTKEEEKGLENWAQLSLDLEQLGREKVQALGYEDAPLSQLVVATLAQVRGVKSVLVGCSDGSDVEDLLEALGRPQFALQDASQCVLEIHNQLDFRSQA